MRTFKVIIKVKAAHQCDLDLVGCFIHSERILMVKRIIVNHFFRSKNKVMDLFNISPMGIELIPKSFTTEAQRTQRIFFFIFEKASRGNDLGLNRNLLLPEGQIDFVFSSSQGKDKKNNNLCVLCAW